MNTSHDYRTPLFFINGELLADGSIPPTKLQSGIPGSLLQDGSVPPAKLQSGIPGSLLQDGSVPPAKLQSGIPGSLLQNGSVSPAKLQANIPGSYLDVGSTPLNRLVGGIRNFLNNNPFVGYPDTTYGLYRTLNAFRAYGISNPLYSISEILIVPFILLNDITLNSLSVFCGSVTTSGSMNGAIYDINGNRLGTISWGISTTGLITSTLSNSVPITAGQIYYIGFARFSGSYSLTSYQYLSMDLISLGTSAPGTPYGVIAASGSTLPTSLSGNLTPLNAGNNRNFAPIVIY